MSQEAACILCTHYHCATQANEGRGDEGSAADEGSDEDDEEMDGAEVGEGGGGGGDTDEQGSADRDDGGPLLPKLYVASEGTNSLSGAAQILCGDGAAAR